MKKSDVLLLAGMVLAVAGAAVLIYGIVTYNNVRASVGNALGKLLTGRSPGENEAVIEMIAGGAAAVLGAACILFRGRGARQPHRGRRYSGGSGGMEITDRIEGYLRGSCYPFWFARVAAPEGGFTTYFDRNGRPTGQTDRTLIQQTRVDLHALARDPERATAAAGRRSSSPPGWSGSWTASATASTTAGSGSWTGTAARSRPTRSSTARASSIYA